MRTIVRNRNIGVALWPFHEFYGISVHPRVRLVKRRDTVIASLTAAKLPFLSRFFLPPRPFATIRG